MPHSRPPFWRLLFNREVITYLIAGVLTTLVNLLIFTVLTRFFGADRWWISNLPAIFLAMLFAFYVNRLWVFRSHGPVLKEMIHFFAGRIVISLAFEYGAMYLLYNLLGLRQSLALLSWSLPISKLLTQALVVVGNYFISKWLIFNRQPKPPVVPAPLSTGDQPGATGTTPPAPAGSRNNPDATDAALRNRHP